MVKRQKPTGVCRLTGRHGAFVKAHIIPAALTRPAAPGMPFIQGGLGTRPTQRWSSWYDDALVIRKGEDILTEYDTWGIAELRRLKLVWSGWEGHRIDCPDYQEIPGTPDWGFRQIKTRDPAKLRLFFLSLLWRAAASRRFEFAEIDMPPDHLEQLRHMLLNRDAGPIGFYPAQLNQLSSKGDIHNMTPIAADKQMYTPDGEPTALLPTFRFYMEGLAVHMTRQDLGGDRIRELGPLIVGNAEDLVVSAVSYEKSFQRENLQKLIAETMRLPK